MSPLSRLLCGFLFCEYDEAMRIDKIEISDLRPYERNARVHGERNMAAIRSSLHIYGQVEPLVVQRSSNTVIGGNGRLECMKELGWTHAHAVLLDIDDDQLARLSVALNRTSELSTWDNEALHEILSDFSDEQLEDTGFSRYEVEALVEWNAGQADIDSIKDYDEEKDTYQIKIDGVRIDDKERLLAKVKAALKDEAGLKIDAY